MVYVWTHVHVIASANSGLGYLSEIQGSKRGHLSHVRCLKNFACHLRKVFEINQLAQTDG